MASMKKRSDNAIAAKSPSKRAAEPEEGGHQDIEGSSAVKRRKAVGVRVIGRRIYDSENGKTCHQCRQKTIDLMASCKATSGSKPCTQHFCAKCLLNRYGEKVSEVDQLSEWSCPKCRGECNCSICLKKRGCMPTGILAHTAKATGFNSVAELLKKQPDLAAERAALLEPSSQQAGSKKRGRPNKNNANPAQSPISQDKASPIKSLTKSMGSSAKKRKLVVKVDGQVDGPVANALLRSSPVSGQKSSALNGCHSGLPKGKKEKMASAAKRTLDGFLVAKSKKRVTFDFSCETLPAMKSSNGMQKMKKPEEALPLVSKKTKPVKKKSIESGVKHQQGSINPTFKLKKKSQVKKAAFKVFEEKTIVLPPGEPLATVAGMDFPAKAVGPALQFVEFCSAFKSVLGLRRGDAEAMLREFTKGRIARKGPNSLLVQLHAKLLKLIVENESSELDVTESSTGKRSWLTILKKHLIERSCTFTSFFKEENMDASEENGSVKEEPADEGYDKMTRSMPSSSILKEDLRAIKDAIIGGPEAYENLGVYHKLQLLVILCDDSLETQSMRECMESANREFSEVQKEKREEVLAARKEVREARQKIKDAEAAKLLALGNITGPLSPEEKQALLSRVQAETERAEAAFFIEKEAVSRMNKSRSDALRTDAIAVGHDGLIFYKLKGVDDMNSVVVQTGVGDDGLHGPDSWRFYSKLEEHVLTKYLLQRARVARKKMLAEGGGVPGDEEKENRMPICD